MPVDPVARLEELEDLLSALPGEPMLASTLDGFVAGILVCPTLVLPGEWLPEVWGADATIDPAPVFKTEQQAKDVTRLIMAQILWHDGIGMSLYAKRLESGRFVWPTPTDGVVGISASQLAYMLDGIDWRNPRHTFRPSCAG